MEDKRTEEIKTRQSISWQGLKYQYPSGAVISFPDFSCYRGDHVLISGSSGSGKTTLLHLLSGLRKMQEGRLEVAGYSLEKASQKTLNIFRASSIGLVFQLPRFISSLDAIGNVEIAQSFGKSGQELRPARAILDDLNIGHLAKKSPGELSGGERQRLAIARALASSPAILLADEPTSSLDDKNANMVENLLKSEAIKNRATLVVVSHDGRLKPGFETVIAL